jgi:hypothetical protein
LRRLTLPSRIESDEGSVSNVEDSQRAFTVNNQLHILHLDTIADNTIGYATEARFMDSGLAFSAEDV